MSYVINIDGQELPKRPRVRRVLQAEEPAGTISRSSQAGGTERQNDFSAENAFIGKTGITEEGAAPLPGESLGNLCVCDI